MVNRDTAGAFGARSSADGSAADSRTQAALQPDAQIGRARLLHQARSDGCVSAASDLGEAEYAARNDVSRAVYRQAEYRPCGASAVAHPGTASVLGPSRSRRTFFAVHLRSDGALCVAVQSDRIGGRIRRTGEACNFVFTRTVRTDSGRACTSSRTGGGCHALRGGA